METATDLSQAAHLRYGPSDFEVELIIESLWKGLRGLQAPPEFSNSIFDKRLEGSLRRLLGT